MWEFRTGNTFGATAFTSYGAFWLSFFVFVTFFADKVPAADTGHAVGLYLIAWGIFTAYMFIASLRTTAAIATVFLLLTATFIVLGIGDAAGNDSITKLGGFIGLATAAAAWYASFAVVTNSTFGRTLLPVKPLARRRIDLRRGGQGLRGLLGAAGRGPRVGAEVGPGSRLVRSAEREVVRQREAERLLQLRRPPRGSRQRRPRRVPL